MLIIFTLTFHRKRLLELATLAHLGLVKQAAIATEGFGFYVLIPGHLASLQLEA